MRVSARTYLMDGYSGEPDKDMTRQQNSSSAAFSIITARPGEEWTARRNDSRINYIRENAEATVSLHQPHHSAEHTEVAAGGDVYSDEKYPKHVHNENSTDITYIHMCCHSYLDTICVNSERPSSSSSSGAFHSHHLSLKEKTRQKQHHCIHVQVILTLKLPVTPTSHMITLSP